MSLSHRYKNFGGAGKPAKQSANETKSEILEDQKLQAFEAGYQAGWDDATKARAQEKDTISSELGQNLLDMSFTYQEALLKMTQSFEPVMRKIIEKLLPEIVQTALSAHILQQLDGISAEYGKAPVEIVVSEKNLGVVKTLIGDKLKDPFELVAENSLGDGQAFVRIGEVERQVDLDRVVSEVNKAMTAFFSETSQEVENEQPGA